MYEVAAAINDVELRKVPLNDDFSLNTDRLLSAADENTRVVFLCSPNNPTGNSFPVEDIIRIADTVNGIVVVDEAYIHYSPHASVVDKILQHNNIVVLRTLSKARGMAGLRVGMAIAVPEIIEVMSMVKYPYNISEATMIQALKLLEKDKLVETSDQIKTTIEERARLATELEKFDCVKKIYPSDANFILVKVDNADRLYDYLADRGTIVRNRTRVAGCTDCLRITIGLKEENDRVIETIRNYEKETAYN